jgi:predicted Zn-dependent protease
MMHQLTLLTCLSAVIAFAQVSEKERALGQQVIKEIGRTWKIVETPEAVTAVAQNLSAHGPIEVKVIESNQLVANSLPGGIVYVSTALLQSATQPELRAILAHQIGHITARHGQTSVERNNASVPVIFMGGWVGICTRLTESGSLLPKTFEARSLAFEAEADSLASHYLQRAGYEVTDLKAAFDRLRAVIPEDPKATPRKPPTLLR